MVLFFRSWSRYQETMGIERVNQLWAVIIGSHRYLFPEGLIVLDLRAIIIATELSHLS